MNVEIKWTEARIERAAKLWQDGLSASQIAFAQLGRFQCTWPLTDFEDDDGPEMDCCGRKRRGGSAPNSPYCAEHAAVARGAA